jgi:two-component system, response regulator PdtaR
LQFVKRELSSITVGSPARHSDSRRPHVVFARDEASGAGAGPNAAPRIVVVEDDYLVASQVEAALTDAGFDVVGVASSADDALRLAGTERPTLMVMDIRLSGDHDGVEAALEMFEQHGVRCVFATAHHTPEVRARARPAAPLAWLRKPYTMAALVDAVRRAVREVDGGKS